MSKKEKKESKSKSKKEMIIIKDDDLYDDLPDGLLEAIADEKLASAYTALYITIFAFLVTTIIALFLMYSQYQLLAEIMDGTSVHIPSGMDPTSYSGTINTGTW